jgi:MFS-type transporter involved in bile tolerance (Atg22 family)
MCFLHEQGIILTMSADMNHAVAFWLGIFVIHEEVGLCFVATVRSESNVLVLSSESSDAMRQAVNQ